MKLSHLFVFSFFLNLQNLLAQCPDFESTDVTPSCIPSCELCAGDQITINLKGNDLPNGGKVDFYFNSTTGFNPYQGQGTFIGSSTITTPSVNCRICPELIGFMIDACGTEANNEFIVMWTGSGFNTSNFVFDYASQNNTGGGGNADIGSGCSVQAGGGAGVGGCMATQVGAGYALPANAIWIVFCSSAVNFSYDFSAVCALGLKVFVSTSTCTRTIGAFTNGGGSGTRTQGFSINGCACGNSVSYDLNDPNLLGDGDSWAGGISNNGCSANVSGAGNYIPAKSTISPFTYKIPNTWCDKTFEIVGIVNPKPDPMCCKEIFTERLSITVKCPVANKTSLEVCDDGTGKGKFFLEDAEATILGTSSGFIEWFRDITGMIKISSPYTTLPSTVYARIKDGNCVSALVPIELKVTPFSLPKSTSEERCADKDGYATFLLINLENYIKNGNNAVNVKFYEDINKSVPIAPPYRTETITIYATTCKGDCESNPVPIKLIVNPIPIAKDVLRMECPETDGKASFDLIQLIPYIKDSINQNIVTFFRDSSLKDTILSPFRTDSATLYAQVSNMKCSNISKVILKSGKLQFNQQINEYQCKDINGYGSFDFIQLRNTIQSGDTSIHLEVYLDSNLINPIIPPYSTNIDRKIYGHFRKNNCISNIFSIQLHLIDRPKANNLVQIRCGNSDNTYDFDLDSLKLLVNNQAGTSVEFYDDLSLTKPLNGIYTTSADTIFAISKNADCISFPSQIILQVIKKPFFTKMNDTISCNSFVLAPIIGKNLTASASYFTSRMASGNPLKKGDIINKSGYIYYYDQITGCSAEDSFYLKIQNPSNAGSDIQSSICDGNKVDLKNFLQNADPNGTFIEQVPSGNLTGSVFNTTGLNGNNYTIYYIVNSLFPCPPDTAQIVLQIVNKVSSGLDSAIDVCSIDSIDLKSLLRNADIGGVFTDQLNQVIPSVIKASNYGFGLYQFFYTVGDNKSCPKSTSTLSIRFQQSIVVDPIPNTGACNYFVLKDITGLNTFNKSAYFSQPGRKGKKYFSGDTIYTSTKLFVTGTDLKFCTNEVAFTITINSQTTQFIRNKNLCTDYFLIIGGQRFDTSLTMGKVVIKALNPMDCDTVYDIQLDYNKPAIFDFDSTLCEGSSILVNGNVYNELNPSGIERLKNASAFGCDSLVRITLRFNPMAVFDYQASICDEDSIIIHGNVYNKNKPMGQEIWSRPGLCDSIVHVKLQVNKSSNGSIQTTLCKNSSIIVNGTIYNFNKPNGTEIISNHLGCDSVIQVQLSFYPESKLSLQPKLCPEDSFKIDTLTLDASRPNFYAIFKAASSNGCDSTVDIQLQFYPASKSSYTRQLCPGQSVIVNGTRYDQNKTSGIEILKNLSASGCDSMVDIRIVSVNNVFNYINPSLCPGDSILIGNKYYSEHRILGIDTLQSSGGCDSIVDIKVQLLPISVSKLEKTICIEDELVINGKVYNRTNTQGIERFSGQSANGCDSLLEIKLTIADLQVDAVQNYDVILGNSVQLNVDARFKPSSILWSPSTGLSCIDCLSPIVTPSEDTEYTLSLTDENGCTIYLKVRVAVIKDIRIFVPNAFSPNGDLTNDLFELITNSNDLKIVNYFIFDRWGELVYSIQNSNIQDYKAWDGTFKGEKANPGVYTYYILLEDASGLQKTLKGDITLIR